NNTARLALTPPCQALMEVLKQYAGLCDDEISVFDAGVKEKLEIAFDNIAHEATSSKENQERLAAEHAQTVKVLEGRLQELGAECDRLREKSSDYEDLLRSADEKFRRSYEEKEQHRSKTDELQTINNELSFAVRNLENEKEMLSSQLRCKIEQIEDLSTEIKALKAETESVHKLKIDTMLRSEDVSSREAALKAQESRWVEECASMQRHIEWLEGRLRQTTDQLLTARRDTSQKCCTLESELESRKIELEHAKETIQRLEDGTKKLTQANENYIEKLKQVADEQIRLEQLYGNELEAQKQLISLYKEQLADLEEKNTELTEAAGSMQSMLRSAYENVARLESEKSALQAQHTEEQAKQQESSKQLAIELERSRQLLDKFRVDGLSEEELRQLNPAVAATLSALKRGHSLTQLYTDYIQIVEDRDQLRLDKQRLTEYVKQLVDDVKEKAPLLREQQEKYKRMKDEIKDLTAQLQSTTGKLEESNNQRLELQRRAGYYQREVARLKHTCGDLSKQVQLLLREIEVSRGTVIEQPTLDPSESSVSSPVRSAPSPDSSTMTVNNATQLLDGIASASVVIGEHLVTWRNLQELQWQNQRLLGVARDLANQLEQREQDEAEASKRANELSLRLESLSGELEVVRLAAQEARNDARLSSHQRDLYRSLLKRYDIEVSLEHTLNESLDSDTSSLNVTSDKPHDKSNTTMTAATMERMEETLSSLEAEFKRYRDNKTESDKIYSTTIEQLRKEGNEARILNQKLASQLDFTHEKLRTVEANVSGYKQEITVLREMNARYSTSAAASEAELVRLREDLLRTSDKLLQVEVDARQFSRQLEIARANENRWRQEAEALRRQEQMHTQLMRQLEAIQGNLEQRDSVDRSIMEKRVGQLELQLSEAQSAFTEASQASKRLKETLEHELEVSQHKATTAESEVGRLQTLVTSLEKELEVLKPKKDSTTGSEADEDGSSAEATNKDSLSRQMELQHEVDSLRMRVDAAREQADKMRDLAENAEIRLNEMMQETQLLQERLGSELEQTTQRCEFLEAQLDLEKKERQNLVNENIRTTEEAHQLNAELHRQLSSLQGELDSIRTRCESALELEAGAKSVIEAHERAAQEARLKYERELSLHAEDVEALTAARQEVDNWKSKLADVQRQLTTSESRADTVAKELDDMSRSWDTERQELNEKLHLADKDQSLMQDQIIKLTQQLIALRKLMEKPNETTEPSGSTSELPVSAEAGVTDLKASEDLLQLVNYLRRQKSIAEATCDASAAEVSRLLLRVASLESQRDHLQTELENERRASELAAETSQRHSELMERVEQLNLLTESNRLLRHERETLQANLKTSEGQVRDLEALVGPLRSENSELMAQVNSLGTEKHSLEEERDRWKERCNRLVETAQRMDPEQYRMACNERDELQRQLRRAEEEVQQYSVKLNESRTELNEAVKRHDAELNEALASRQAAEEECVQHRSTCETLRKELEGKETTVVKLREIGRKYRQEAETLRRQLFANQSDGAQLQSLNEALTEAKADLVTLRSDLATVRSQRSHLASVIAEVMRVLNTAKANEHLGQSFGTIHLPTADGEYDNEQLVEIIRLMFDHLAAEISQLRQHAETQRERLLRMQLVESQLTKAQRDCAELRARLSEMQSAPAAVSVPSAQNTPAVIVPSSASLIVNEPEPTDLSQTSQSFPFHLTLFGTPVSCPDSTVTGASDSLFPVAGQTTQAPAVSVSTSTSLGGQSVPAWILRASATVQPVQPTPAVTPPNSVVGPKQTAEIRPITSNVATVTPTPAIQIVQTTSVAAPPEPLLIPSVPLVTAAVVTASDVTPLSSTTGLVSPLANDQLTVRLDQPATAVVRAAQSRRTNLLGPAPPLGDQSAIASSSFTGFSWATSTTHAPVSSPSLASVTGKRRHEDASAVSDSSMVSSSEETLTSNTPTDTSRLTEPVSFTPYASVPAIFSEAKRLRPMAVLASTSHHIPQAEPSAVVLERSAFGYPTSLQPLAHATASRLVAGQEGLADAWSMSAPSAVATPITAPTPSLDQSSVTVLSLPAAAASPDLRTVDEDQGLMSGDFYATDVALLNDAQANEDHESEVTQEPELVGLPRSGSFRSETREQDTTAGLEIAGSDGTTSVETSHAPILQASQEEFERVHPVEDSTDLTSDSQCLAEHYSHEQHETGEQVDEDAGVEREEEEIDEGFEHEIERQYEEYDEEQMSEVVSEGEVEEEEDEVEDEDQDEDYGYGQEEPVETSMMSTTESNVIELSSDSDNNASHEDGSEVGEEEEGEDETVAYSRVDEPEQSEEEKEHPDVSDVDDDEGLDELGERPAISGVGDDAEDDVDRVSQDEGEEEHLPGPQGKTPEEAEGSPPSMHRTSVTTTPVTRQAPVVTNVAPTPSPPVLFSSATFGDKPGAGLFGSFDPKAPITGGLFAGFRPSAATGLTTSDQVSSSGPTTSSTAITPGLFRSSVLAQAGATPVPSALFKPSLFATSTSSAEKPATSEGVQAKPKIQPIVWDAPESPSTVQPSVTETSVPRIGAARRKKWGGPSVRPGSYLGASGGTGAAKPDSFGSSRGGSSGTCGTRPGPRRG
ncbi:Nucleoprotein tpr, partial [Clonorchis sinensis]